MKALVLHQSIRGKTEKYASEIANYLNQKGCEPNVKSIIHFEVNDLNNVDIVLFGCWTNGILIALQHPDKEWVKWAKALPLIEDKRIGFFATYIVATGSMFKKMKKCIKTQNLSDVELKSKNGKLSENDKEILDRLLK